MTAPAGPGGLLPFTAPWLPSPADVRNELGPNRQAVLTQQGITDPEIARTLSAKGGAVAAELPVSLPQHLWQSAHDYVLYASCAVIEARCFPEQGNSQDSNRDWYSSQAGIEMSRLRGQLGEDATGVESDFVGTVPLGLPSTRYSRRFNYGGRFGRW